MGLSKEERTRVDKEKLLEWLNELHKEAKGSIHLCMTFQLYYEEYMEIVEAILRCIIYNIEQGEFDAKKRA